MKKIISAIITVILISFCVLNVSAVNTLDDTCNFLLSTTKNPTVAATGGEWTVTGLARSGFNIPDGYFDTYYNNLENSLKEKNGILHQRKYTEYSRAILAVTSIGKDPQNVAGYDITEPLYNFEKTVGQGINGAIWALIALDCGNYGTKELKDRYLSFILDNELKNGGWCLSGNIPDADITAMALIALSKHTGNKQAEDAVNCGISLLSEMQDENGGYSSYGTKCSESSAQVLTAISSLGISYTDERFIKNGKSLKDNILSFKQADGSFAHTDTSSLMATEQCFYALVSANRLEENKAPLFDMRDIKAAVNPKTAERFTDKGITNGLIYHTKAVLKLTLLKE